MVELADKKRIAASFSRHSSTYDTYAAEQLAGSAELGAYAAHYAADIAPGPVLEIGCGTGFLSAELAAIFPDRDLEFTDLSSAMLAHCRERIAAAGRARPTQCYRVLDGDRLDVEGRYALVAANFVVHWFADLAGGLARMARALQPGGLLLCAYPGVDSYREWREQCLRQGVPCSANLLPNRAAVAAALEGVAIEQWQREVRLRFACAREFFGYLQRTGAGISTRGVAPRPRQLRRLIRGWDEHCPGGVDITCDVHYLAARKEG
ncbi:MAG: methyltransferase [Candidatus Latescibacteria bacterium]|nr:methyltransferase [Candidatus Latescibacterota bacterium]